MSAEAQGSNTRGPGGRLPLLKDADLNDNQKTLRGQMQPSLDEARQRGFSPTDHDGHLVGPWNILLQRPELGTGYSTWSAAERKGTSLADSVREVVILTVGSAWDSAYELYAHTAWARSVQLDETLIDAIRLDAVGDDVPEPERTAHRFTRALVRERRVDDQLYASAEELFGQAGVVDMVHLIGLYLGTSAFLNAFEVPVPIPDRGGQ